MEIEQPKAVSFYGHTITRPRMIEQFPFIAQVTRDGWRANPVQC